MAQSGEAELDLATLLERHTEEIASAHVEAVLKLPGSHYQTRPRDDMLRWSCRETTDVAAALRTGSNAEMARYTCEVVRLRLSQGFDTAEFVQAVIRLPRGEAN